MAGDSLTTMLRRVVCDGITRKVSKNINAIRNLDMSNLAIGDLNFNWNLRQLKSTPIGGDLNFDWNLPQVKTTPIGGDLNLNYATIDELPQLKTGPISCNLDLGGLNLKAELVFDW